MGIFTTIDKIVKAELAGHTGEAKMLREQFNASPEADRIRLVMLAFALGKADIAELAIGIGAMILKDLREELENAKRD